MGLKIKEGVEIRAYGSGCEAFTSESDLSQAILEHLQIRFPDDIEDDAAIEVVVTEADLIENPELVEAGVEVGEVLLVEAETIVEVVTENDKQKDSKGKKDK